MLTATIFAMVVRVGQQCIAVTGCIPSPATDTEQSAVVSRSRAFASRWPAFASQLPAFVSRWPAFDSPQPMVSKLSNSSSIVSALPFSASELGKKCDRPGRSLYNVDRRRPIRTVARRPSQKGTAIRRPRRRPKELQTLLRCRRKRTIVRLDVDDLLTS